MRQDPKTIIDIEEDPGLHRRPLLQQFRKVIPPFKMAKYHWTPDKPDSRDHKYAITYKEQPNIVDLRPYCTPIENQGNLGSCTGQSIAGAIELLNKRANRTLDASRLFIYYYERLILGTINYDSGAYIRDGIKASYTYGAPLENLWPYNIGKFKVVPSKEARADALKRKVTSYQRIENHDGCLDALNNGYPVVIGFNVYSSFDTVNVAKTGIMPYPKIGRERLLGGHAVLLVGYNKNKQVYIARNSWGAGWGDRGYFYMPFQVIQNTNMSSDFWIIKSVSNP
jgi:C1A family cysteine protease